MNLQIHEILDLRNSMEIFNSLILPFGTVYKIHRLSESLTAPAQFYEEQRRKLVLDCAARNEDGSIVSDERNNAVIAEDQMKEFTDKFNELLLTSVEVAPVSFRVSEFESCNLKPTELSSAFVRYFITD